jgi:hypothetical protein
MRLADIIAVFLIQPHAQIAALKDEIRRMKLEFSIIFASLHRDLEASRLDGASQAAAAKLRVDVQTGKELHASPKRVTSSTAALEEIASPEKVTLGDLHHFSKQQKTIIIRLSKLAW